MKISFLVWLNYDRKMCSVVSKLKGRMTHWQKKKTSLRTPTVAEAGRGVKKMLMYFIKRVRGKTKPSLSTPLQDINKQMPTENRQSRE